MANSSVVRTVEAGKSGMKKKVVENGGELLYGTDPSLIAATITHFLLIEVVFLSSALFLGWMEFNFQQIALMTLTQLVAFFIVWMIMFFLYK